MSLIAYRESLSLACDDPDFDALIMAAMCKADDTNLDLLKTAFPEVFTELQARYNAPGGALNEQELAWVTRLLEGEQAEPAAPVDARPWIDASTLPDDNRDIEITVDGCSKYGYWSVAINEWVIYRDASFDMAIREFASNTGQIVTAWREIAEEEAK